MLVLQRHADESIIITTESGERITVMVGSIFENKVKLGIEAPGHIKIHREEVQERIDRGQP